VTSARARLVNMGEATPRRAIGRFGEASSHRIQLSTVDVIHENELHAATYGGQPECTIVTQKQ